MKLLWDFRIEGLHIAGLASLGPTAAVTPSILNYEILQS
jgi:hypothetical protein